jgi:hypothetical protein
LWNLTCHVRDVNKAMGRLIAHPELAVDPGQESAVAERYHYFEPE